jgi:ribosome-binding factor A
MSRRTLKAASAIREVVSSAILLELQDPRVQDVTVIGVEVMPDMRQAKVHVSITGDEKKQALGLRGLQNAAGFMQQRIADRIETRYIPKLTFVLDKGVKQSIEISRMLSELLPKEPSEAPDDPDEKPPAPPE